MLFAHIVPGYFVATHVEQTQTTNSPQRATLWITSLGSCVVQDTDVVYNVVLRGFFNHSTLYTHSLFVPFALALAWGVLVGVGRGGFWRTLLGVATLGGFSHLVLDAIAHNTPMFYPLSTYMVGIAPASVVQGGVRVYVVHPLMLVEILMLAAIGWSLMQQRSR